MTSTTPHFLRIEQVIALTGKSRSRLYADPSFPKPLKIDRRASAWDSREVIAWMNAKLTAAGKRVAA